MRYICSIYKDRPKPCIGYPWNIANQIFEDCQFLNKEQDGLLSMDDLLETKTEKEISDYCVECGKCCFFGPAACSKLLIVEDEVEREDEK
tara:strand:+ start:1841 stop:2110 length:270 start_codon:yes stop_codon:yes gene_type:complete